MNPNDTSQGKYDGGTIPSCALDGRGSAPLQVCPLCPTVASGDRWVQQEEHKCRHEEGLPARVCPRTVHKPSMCVVEISSLNMGKK